MEETQKRARLDLCIQICTRGGCVKLDAKAIAVFDSLFYFRSRLLLLLLLLAALLSSS